MTLSSSQDKVEEPSCDQQLEALASGWREFPLLFDAATRARQVFNCPEEYNLQDSLGHARSFIKEFPEGMHSSRGIVLLYMLPPSEEGTVLPGQQRRTFLEGCFYYIGFRVEPHIFLIDAKVDEEGKILNETPDGRELNEKEMGEEIDRFSQLPSLIKPHRINILAWSGWVLEVLPRDEER